MSKKVLMTGVSGFVGSNCLKYFLKTTDWEIVGIASYRHKGQISRLEEVRKRCGDEDWKKFTVYKHDLTVPIDRQLENLLLDRKINERGVVVENLFDYILNFASDSAVERSAIDPTYCVRNNVELMLTMLEFARKFTPKIFLQVSSDEVYGEAPPLPSLGHKEWATIMPSNPYSSSKAAQENLCIAYWRTYNLPIIITNTANLICEFQDPEKFLPKIIQYIATEKEMPIYGDNESSIGSRIYLDVMNKASALKYILENAPPATYSAGAICPDRYNITGEDEVNNLELARMVSKIMGKPLKYKLVPSESARPGYDKRYALDGSKLGQLGWKPQHSLKESLERIVFWTLNNPHWLI
jgi:dTDP-glucose 4,6-dehydratase